MFVKPNQNPKYAAIQPGKAGHEPERVAFKVYDPARRDFLPPEGREVGEDNGLYWARRVSGAEVAVLDAAEAAASLAEAERKNKAAAAEAERASKAETKAAGDKSK